LIVIASVAVALGTPNNSVADGGREPINFAEFNGMTVAAWPNGRKISFGAKITCGLSGYFYEGKTAAFIGF
jgi:hypothetical protein